jgi:uncharacterized membrane protein
VRVVGLAGPLVALVLVRDEWAGRGAFHRGPVTVGHPGDDTRHHARRHLPAPTALPNANTDAACCGQDASTLHGGRTPVPKIPVVSRASLEVRRSRLTLLLERRDDFGLALLLIIATVVVISLGQGRLGQMVSVALSGFTLLFVLHTSGARRRPFRAAAVIVVLAVSGAALALLVGVEYGVAAASLIGLMLAFVAPMVILRRILKSPVITVRLVLGALAIYLLLGLAYAYLYPLVAFATNTPFFVQTSSPEDIDFVYFSYVTLTTVGYGDFTAATSTGRMIAVSEALTGQLYLVSAVALLVGNIGRSIVRGGPATGVEIESLSETETKEDDARAIS